MTESEVQALFVTHSFAEAKKMLIEECTRNGHELLGHENVFELRALATQGSKFSKEQEEKAEFALSAGTVPQNPFSATENGGEGVAGSANAGEGEGEGQGGEGKSSEGESSGGSQGNGEGEKGENGEGESNEEKTPEQLEQEANEKMQKAKEQLAEAERLSKEAEEKRRKQREQEQANEQKNNRHYLTDEVVERLKCIGKAFLVGPAGTGKSTLAMCACRELFGIEGTLEDVVKSPYFAQISFSPDTVSADMLGFTDVNGVFHETEIIRVFRDGGLILFDEMDDADASLLVKLNTMLANRVIPTPNGMVTQNENTYIVGTANTFGTGGNSMYVGRSRLDAATLDRWKMATIFVDYDLKLEKQIRNKYLNEVQNIELEIATKTIRDAIEANKWKQICSTRFVIDCCKLMANKFPINKCIDIFLLSWEKNNAKIVKTTVKNNLKLAFQK